jgi:hypothetical protein
MLEDEEIEDVLWAIPSGYDLQSYVSSIAVTE